MRKKLDLNGFHPRSIFSGEWRSWHYLLESNGCKMLVHGLDGLVGQHLMDLRNLPQGVNLQFDPHTGLWLVLSISWSILLNYIRVFWIMINVDLKDRMYLKHATFFSVVWWGMCLTFCKSNCSWCVTTANYFCTKNFLENLYLLCKALWSSISSVMMFF